MTRLLLTHKAALTLLKELSLKGSAPSNHCVTHLDDATVYSAPEEDMDLMIWAADCHVKNPTKPFPFHSVSFYKRRHLFFLELRQAHASYTKCKSFSFAEFLKVELPTTLTKCIEIETQFFNTMRFFDYNPRDKA